VCDIEFKGWSWTWLPPRESGEERESGDLWTGSGVRSSVTSGEISHGRSLLSKAVVFHGMASHGRNLVW
jgi:hypothetical protein